MTITRKSERRRAIRNTAVVSVTLSLLTHLLLLALVVPGWLEKLAEAPDPPPPPRELEVEAVYEEVELEEVVTAPEPGPQPEAAEPSEPVEVQLSAEIRDAATQDSMMVASREPLDPEPQPRSPEPPPAPPAAEQAEPAELEEVEPVTEEQSPVIVQKPKADPRKLLMPDAAAYEQVFADADVTARERARERSKGKRLFENYEATSEGVRASLRSFGHDVRPGNHTGVNRKSNAFGSYVGMIHHKIHERWAHGYLMDLDIHEPGGSPMNDPTLNTQLEFVIRAEDGKVESVNIVRSSGQVRFDAQAAAIAHSIGPHPNPPPELVSPNGRVYVHWNFWRDQRQCGTFGASVYIVSEQGSSPG